MKIDERIALDTLYAAGLGSFAEIKEWRQRRLEANLRDQFAMAAMAGMFANGQRVHGEDPITQRAQYAYATADAMLKARDA